MTRNFDYLKTITEVANANIEIESVGNCCIQALNDLGFEWFLIIKTELGWSYIQTFGPFNVEKPDYFTSGFNFNFYTLEYNEKKLCKIIDNFINDEKKIITQVLVDFDKEEAYNKLKNINLEEMR